MHAGGDDRSPLAGLSGYASLFMLLFNVHRQLHKYVLNALQLKEPTNDDVPCILVLPPHQGCGYDKLLTELCEYHCLRLSSLKFEPIRVLNSDRI